MKDRYILHYGQIAGMSYHYALALRRMGLLCQHVIPIDKDYAGLDPSVHPGLNRALPYGKALSEKSDGWAAKLQKRLRFVGHILRNCNLVHYQGTTILRALDSHLFAYFKITMQITFAGGEARILEIARRYNPYIFTVPDPDRDTKVKRFLKSVSRYIRYAATDCELSEYVTPYFEKVFILRQPIDMNECRCIFPNVNNKKPLILHIPTDREVKGTPFVLKAIDRMKAEGLSFDFRLQEPNLTQRQVRELLSTADIIVDELRGGAHGITAAEAYRDRPQCF